MRRKSTRNVAAAKPGSPEKAKEEKSLKKTRRHSKRHKQTTSESESDDAISLSSTDNNTKEPTEKELWTVTQAEPNDVGKIKLCLSRPSPATPERSSKRLRNKPLINMEETPVEVEFDEKPTRRSRRRTAAGSSPSKKEDTVIIIGNAEESVEVCEEKRGKGKSKGKHKSKIVEQTTETEMQSEISENVQVTAQSPQKDNTDVEYVDRDSTQIEDESSISVATDTANDEPPKSQSPDNRDPRNLNENEIVDNSSDNDISNNNLINEPVPLDKTNNELDESTQKSNEDALDVSLQNSVKFHEISSDVSMKEVTHFELNETASSVNDSQSEQSAESKEKPVESIKEIEKEEAQIPKESIKDIESVDAAQKQSVAVNEPIDSDEISEKPIVSENKKEEDSEKSTKKDGKESIESVDKVSLHEEHDEKVEVKEKEMTKKEQIVQEPENEDICPKIEEKTKEIQEKIYENKEEIVVKHRTNENLNGPESTEKISPEKPSLEVSSATTKTTEKSPAHTMHPRTREQSPKETSNLTSEEQVLNVKSKEKVPNMESKEKVLNVDESKEKVPNVESEEKVPNVDESDEKVPKTTREPLEMQKEDSISMEESLEIQDDKVHDEMEMSQQSPVRGDHPQIKHADRRTAKNLESLASSIIGEATTLRTRYWGKANIPLDIVEVSTTDVKVMYPNLALVDEKNVKMGNSHHQRSSYDVVRPSERATTRRVSVEDSTEASVVSENSLAFNRKISIVDDEASSLRPPPSPAKNDVSDVLFITNLVRPFTVKQLRGLLERTGRIKEDGFWTDKIKSKCYAHYESVSEAEATRNALHGVLWPVGNGKKLIIEYATLNDLETAKNPPVPVVPPPVQNNQQGKENFKPDGEAIKGAVVNEGNVQQETGGTAETEWSLEGGAHTRDNHRSRRSSSSNRDHSIKRRHSRSRRSRSPTPDYKKRSKKEEAVPPQRAMDDLFKKTETMPSIYWQPLSPEEIALKQQQRQERMEAHKRKMESTKPQMTMGLKRGGGGLEYARGGPYRRRY